MAVLLARATSVANVWVCLLLLVLGLVNVGCGLFQQEFRKGFWLEYGEIITNPRRILFERIGRVLAGLVQLYFSWRIFHELV